MKKMISIRLYDWEIRKLDEWAEELGVDRTKVIEYLIIDRDRERISERKGK